MSTEPGRGERATLRPEPVAGARPDTLRITKLVRGEDVPGRSVNAVRQLLLVVAAWGPACALEVTHGRQGGTRSRTTFHVNGPVPDGWHDDLEWALDGVAVLARERQALAPAPCHLVEVVARRSAWREQRVDVDGQDSREDYRDPMTAELIRLRSVRRDPPWSRPLHADLADILRLNLADRPSAIVLRHQISAASPLEEELLRDELTRTYDERTGSVHDYFGTPVRLRTFVGDARPLPARVRVLLREWGTAVDVVDVPGADAARLWATSPLQLAGRTVPLGFALGSVRLPTAGITGFPGYATTQSRTAARALDPLPPKADRPVRLGRALTAEGRRVDVALDFRDLTQHVFVQGASGSGKSTLLAALVVETISAGGGVTLLDPPGATVTAVLEQLRAEHSSTVRLVRHGSDDLNSPVNIISGDRERRERMISLYAEMLQRALDPGGEGVVGPRWKRWFTLLTTACAEVLGEDANLVTTMALGSDVNRIRLLARAVEPRNAELAHRLLHEYGALEGKDAAELTSWAVSKLGEVLATERGRWIFGSGPDGIDVAATMNSGSSLLIDLGTTELGEPTARAIGAAHLLKVFESFRVRNAASPFHLVAVDEAHLFGYGPLPKLMAEARKYNIGLVIATQHLGQLTEELRDALESNTGSFISLRSGIHSAARASVRLDGWDPTELVRLPNMHAAATISRDGIVTPPFSLEIDHRDRMARLAGRGVVGVAVAASVIRSSQATAASWATRTPMDDLTLSRRLNASLPAEPGQARWMHNDRP